MKSIFTVISALALVCLGLCVIGGHRPKVGRAADRPTEKGPLLAHNVFFSLKDNSPAAKKEMVEDSHKYLAPIPGTVFYAAGVVSDVERDVVDRDYDVALHVVFEGKAAMEKYLAHPRHLEYVAKHQPNWKKVRVFDSFVTGAPPQK
jgi:hypothetical protein